MPIKRSPTLYLLALAPLTSVAPQAQTTSLYNLLVRTYTEGSGEGIRVYRFDGADGSVEDPLHVIHTGSPSYLTSAPDQHTLFVVSENGRGGRGDTVGRATSYRSDPVSDHLQQISQVRTLSDRPTYNSLSHNGCYLFAANYPVRPRGSVAILPVCTDGSLAPVMQVGPHQASKVHPRQVSGHVHSVVSSPGGQCPFAPDLDADKVSVYRYAPEQAGRPLQAADLAFVPTPPGDGPHHLIFSADGRFAYLALEPSGQVMVFAHEDNSRLCQLQTHDLAPVGFQDRVGAGTLHLSADGRFLSVLNRDDDNQLVTFAVDPASGQSRFVERHSVGGTEPRGFVFSPNGRFILMANQNSDQLWVFAHDPQSGQVSRVLQSVEVGSPDDLRFVAVP